MKFFLSVHIQNYMDDVDANKGQSIFKRLWDHQKNTPKDVDGLMLHMLREFFRQKIWAHGSRRDWNAWVIHVQERRNAVHAYKDRDIGSFEEFCEDLRIYLEFLVNDLSLSLPEPPDHRLNW